MSNLFERHCSVTIGTKKIDGLRVRFEIEKTVNPQADKCTVVISNLNKETRTIIEKKDTPIVVEAGYKNLSGNVFVGTAYKIKHEKSGSDFETRIDCADGGDKMRRHGSWSFKSKTPVSLVINKIAVDLGMAVSTSSVITPREANIPRGWSFVGLAHEAMGAILAMNELSWYVQDGIIFIFPVSLFGDNSGIFLLSEKTGMVGSPEELEKDKVTKGRRFQVVCLINPNIKPKKIIKIQSSEQPNLNGFYEVIRAKIAGDTHGTEWVMILDLKSA
jgi:hypothetical protein